MFKEACKQIKSSYDEKIFIYPPVLLADESLGEHPSLIFFVVTQKGTDAVFVNSQTADIMGVTEVEGYQFKQDDSVLFSEIDKDITKVCMLMAEDITEAKNVYTDYLRKYFKDMNEMHLFASLCPDLISNDALVNLGTTPKSAKEALSKIRRKIKFMEKDTPDVLKNIPPWIDEVPTAKAYKNAVVAGSGDKLFRVIKMVGNQDAYMTCVTDFAHFLYKMNMIPNETISTTTDGFVHSNVEKFNNNPDNYWFYDEYHNPVNGSRVITFDISNVKTEKESIKKLIEEIGLIIEYDTMEALLSEYSGWESVSVEDFVNNTILKHYETSEDSIMKPSDLEWLYDALKETNAVAKDNNNLERKTEDGPITENSTVDNDKEVEISAESIFRNTLVEDNVLEDNQEDELISVNIKPATLMSIQDEPAHIQDDPVPEKKEKENEKAVEGCEVVKDEFTTSPTPESESNITDDEHVEEETVKSALAKIKYNKELNNQMYDIYEQTATRLKAERDPRWKDFISEYRKAMADEDYTVRTCPRYLTMTSRDVKAPIYKVLYDADQATKKYESEVQRIKRTTMCFACRTTFDADITFAKNKEHTAKCPNCGNLVRMTIDWLN